MPEIEALVGLKVTAGVDCSFVSVKVWLELVLPVEEMGMAVTGRRVGHGRGKLDVVGIDRDDVIRLAIDQAADRGAAAVMVDDLVAGGKDHDWARSISVSAGIGPSEVTRGSHAAGEDAVGVGQNVGIQRGQAAEVVVGDGGADGSCHCR